MELLSENELLDTVLYTIVSSKNNSLYIINNEFFLIYRDYDKAYQYTQRPQRKDKTEVFELTDKQTFFYNTLQLGFDRFLVDGIGKIHNLSSYSNKLVPRNIATQTTPVNTSQTDNHAASENVSALHITEASDMKVPSSSIPAVNKKSTLTSLLGLARKALLGFWLLVCFAAIPSAFGEENVPYMGVCFSLFAIITAIMLFKKSPPKHLWLLYITSLFLCCGIETLVADKDIGAFVVILIFALIPAIPFIKANKPK